MISRPGRRNYVASCGVSGNFFTGEVYLSSDSSGAFETSLLASYQSCSQPLLADITGEYAVLMFDAPIGANEERNVEIVYLGPDVMSSVHETPIPSILGFSRSYPNPFNSRVSIEFGLEYPACVTIDIFDILGQRIETLTKSAFASGEHRLIWDAAEHPSGIYFYRRHRLGIRNGLRFYSSSQKKAIQTSISSRPRGELNSMPFGKLSGKLGTRLWTFLSSP